MCIRDRDATVDYKSGLDFTFTNTLNYPIYIESYVDGDSVTVNIWGVEERSANRTIAFTSTRTTDFVWKDPLYVQRVDDVNCKVCLLYTSGVFSGLAAAHDAGSYTINLKNDQIGQLLERIDMQSEQVQLDKTFVIDLEPLLKPYVDAVIEGMKEADPENAFDQDKKKKQIFDTLQTTFCPHEDYEKEPLAVQFENAVSKGLEVNASICAGKDGAAGTYAFEVTLSLIHIYGLTSKFRHHGADVDDLSMTLLDHARNNSLCYDKRSI